MFRMLAATFLAALVSLAEPASAAPDTVTFLGDGLRAGQLQKLETDLSGRLAANPGDDQERFALGTVQFLRAVEGMAQDMYRHGLEPPRDVMRNLPFFRFPVPPNPKAEPLDYAGMRAILARMADGLTRADATLAGLSSNEVKLPLAVGLAKIDLNGDGTASDDEALWKVMDATLGGGNIPAEAAERYIITFDRADATWLRGYTHLLRALLEFGLAHDWKDGFDTSFHLIFPHAKLPNAVLNDYQRSPDEWFDAAEVSDVIAFIHLMHWSVAEPDRLKASLAHLEQVAVLSRESWRFIAAETDDEAEWIPSPRQKNGVLPATVQQQTVDGWMAFLDEFEAILQGRKLVPHWRLAKGINLRRVFTEPRTFDPILWAQGSAALPYLEDGPMTDQESWGRIMQLLEGNVFGYAIWFN